MVTGKKPVYMGQMVNQIGICKLGPIIMFKINNVNIANIAQMEASVFKGKPFSISLEDAKSIYKLVEALKGYKQDNI